MCPVLPVYFPRFYFALLHLVVCHWMPLISEWPFKSGPHTEHGQGMDFWSQVPPSTLKGKWFAKQTLLNMVVFTNSKSFISLKALETEDEADALTCSQLCHWKTSERLSGIYWGARQGRIFPKSMKAMFISIAMQLYYTNSEFGAQCLVLITHSESIWTHTLQRQPKSKLKHCRK